MTVGNGAIRVLVVDDDFRVAQVHAGIVDRLSGFRVVGLCHTAAEAIAVCTEERPDLVLLDEYLPDRRGTEIMRELGAAVFVITAGGDAPTVRRAVTAGALHVVIKPFGAAELAARLTAFARWKGQLDTAGTLDQLSVDRSYAVLHEGDRLSASLPKGRSVATADLITTAVRDAPTPLTAVAVADLVGVSRATAQRYLADLAQSGRVQLRLRYGATGRPEHEYAWAGGLT